MLSRFLSRFTKINSATLFALVIALSALVSIPGLSWSDLDTIHLSNGDIVHGKIKRVTGEMIVYKSTTGTLVRINRFQLASRRDVLTTNNGRHYLGEIHTVGNFNIAMKTPQGYKEIWKIYHKQIVLGYPEAYPQEVIDSESDRHLQPVPKLFPQWRSKKQKAAQAKHITPAQAALNDITQNTMKKPTTNSTGY